MQREAIIRGPAIVTYNTKTYYTAGDVKVSIEHQTFTPESAMFGKIAPRVSGRLAKVSFTPAGNFADAKSAAGLWPYAATTIGGRIYGDADKNLVVLPLDTTQNMWTFYNAAITKLPPIILSSTKTTIGEVEFTALGKENTAPSTADSLVYREANTFADTSFVQADIVTQPYSAAWGSTLTGIETKNGWTVDFNLSLQPVESDTYGVIDMTLEDLSVVAKCEPLTITEAQIITALGIDKAVGASLVGSNDLVITGTGVSVTVKNSIIRAIEPVWGRTANRLGTVSFEATRTFAAGRPVALYAVA